MVIRVIRYPLHLPRVDAKEIEKRHGGSIRSAFSFSGGDIHRLAVRWELNPFAPHVVFFSDHVREQADLLRTTGQTIQLYVREDTNQWVDFGLIRPWHWVDDVDLLGAWAIATRRVDDETHGPLYAVAMFERVLG